MAWWGALISTAASGIGWLTRNAGDIVNAYGAIKGVMGKADVNTEATDGENLVPRLRRALEANERAMKAAAKKLMKLPQDTEYGETFGPSGRSETITIELTGFYPDPNLDGDRLAPSAMNNDINKLLALYDLPTNLKVGDTHVDIRQQVAAAMSSKPHPIEQALAEDMAKLLATAPINIGPDEHGYLLRGQHIFYVIPTCG